MGYYRGDYYRGDYYRGDPFLGGLLAGAAKLAGPLLGKAAGWATKQVFGSGGAKKVAVAATAAVPILSALPGGSLPTINIGNKTISPFHALPGGEPLFSDNKCPQGFHLDKKTRSKCVRNRSMNALNPRALRRGLRRAEKFEKFARRTVNALRRGPKKFKT